MALFIGIDLGTSGCRAIAINEAGDIQGNVAVELPAPIRKAQCVEQEPTLWWNAVHACLAELTATINPDEISSIAVDGTSATLLLADETGNPLGPALMYNDARAMQQAESIRQVAPPNTAAQGASCTLAKLLWLYQNLSTNKVRYALHQADWISGKLCGQWGTSDFNNALKLGFDAAQKAWPQWLTTLLIDAKIPANILPRVVPPGTAIGTIAADLAIQFNLPQETQIIAGTTDSTASFIATGADNHGEAVTALGSTLVLKVISETPVFAPEYGVYSQPLWSDGKEHWLVGGASNSGGAVLRQYFSIERLQEMTPHLDPDTPTGLDYYPLPATGERFPVNNSQLEPRLDPRPENDILFFQGILEGIATIEARGYRLLSELGAPYPVSVRTTGGGAHNVAWTHIRERHLKTKMMPANHTEAAYGAALLAMTGARTPAINTTVGDNHK